MIAYLECSLSSELLAELIRMSADWEKENSCYGYRKNEKSDIEGNCIFLAKDGNRIVGYLFGQLAAAKNVRSIRWAWNFGAPVCLRKFVNGEKT